MFHCRLLWHCVAATVFHTNTNIHTQAHAQAKNHYFTLFLTLETVQPVQNVHGVDGLRNIFLFLERSQFVLSVELVLFVLVHVRVIVEAGAMFPF